MIRTKKYLVNKSSTGSALILAVVLTSLLAVVGVLFVMMTRIDKIATSAISEDIQLDFAVETVVSRISQELALDAPGSEAEFYDFPDSNDKWLASLEPYEKEVNGSYYYYWRQISDITGYLTGYSQDVQAGVVGEYDMIPDSNTPADADADGDGVSDSRWIKLNDITSDKGKPIYAAVRIIDNGAMLNVNTAYTLNRDDPNDVIGSSQLQINLMSLADSSSAQETALLRARTNNGIGINPFRLDRYEQNVIWNYDEPNSLYTPFDISDELELRYRFILNHTDIDTRLEDWSVEFRNNTLSTPVDSGGQELDAWFERVCDDGTIDPNYAFRHIATIHNMDRILNPAGSDFNNGKMVNINTADVNSIYEAVYLGLSDVDPNYIPQDVNMYELAAQLAVNIVDFRDPNLDITAYPVGQTIFYGFEPQPFISEIAFAISETEPNTPTNNEFAIELYNPFNVDIPLGNFKLGFSSQSGQTMYELNFADYYGIARGGRFVITNGSDATTNFGVAGLRAVGGAGEDPNLVLATYRLVSTDPPAYALDERFDVYLTRTTLVDANEHVLYLDRQQTQDDWFDWDTVKATRQAYSRAEGNWNILYQDMQSAIESLGVINRPTGTKRNYNLAMPGVPAEYFSFVGDISRVLRIGPGTDPCDMIGIKVALQPGEETIRMDLQNPFYSNIFKYLTVIDPESFGKGTDETRIKGRVNINTAPWFVIAQLPWMQPEIARAIVAHREEQGAFDSIADLMQVRQMGYYAYDPLYQAIDLGSFPDFTPSDGAVSDFEERDIIFSRISNLITVQSDIFTAYILVRIGIDGPQRRVLAIFDRSQVSSPSHRVKLIALHPISDPR